MKPVPALAALLASAGALGIALIAQYFFNQSPCVLCLWQRVPLFCVVGLAAMLVPARRHDARMVAGLALVALAFFAAAGIAAFHVGVEQHWWLGTEGCSTGIGGASNAEELRRQLLGTPVAHCDQIGWTFLGLSMATWNVPFSLFMGLYMSVAAWAAMKLGSRDRGRGA